MDHLDTVRNFEGKALVTGTIVAPVRGWGVADQTSFSGSYDAFGDAPVSCPTHLLCLSLYFLGKGRLSQHGFWGQRVTVAPSVKSDIRGWIRPCSDGGEDSSVARLRHLSCIGTIPAVPRIHTAANVNPLRATLHLQGIPHNNDLITTKVGLPSRKSFVETR